MNLIDFRCEKCNKLLGKINGTAEIVCPRCKKLNVGVSGVGGTDGSGTPGRPPSQ